MPRLGGADGRAVSGVPPALAVAGAVVDGAVLAGAALAGVVLDGVAAAALGAALSGRVGAVPVADADAAAGAVPSLRSTVDLLRSATVGSDS